MTNKELEKKIEELSAQIEALKGELKKETPKGEIWKPKEGDEFWYVGSDGEVYSDEYYKIPNKINIGNCYPTEEKAEFEAQREKYTRLFRQYVEQHSEPLDWKDGSQKKWYVYYDYVGEILCYMYNTIVQGIEVYGSSEEVMREAVEFVGRENVLRYILSVEGSDDNT